MTSHDRKLTPDREYDIGSEDDSGWNHLEIRVNSLGQVQWVIRRGGFTLTGYWDAKTVEKLRAAIVDIQVREAIEKTVARRQEMEAASRAETRIRD